MHPEDRHSNMWLANPARGQGKESNPRPLSSRRCLALGLTLPWVSVAGLRQMGSRLSSPERSYHSSASQQQLSPCHAPWRGANETSRYSHVMATLQGIGGYSSSEEELSYAGYEGYDRKSCMSTITITPNPNPNP